MRNPVILILILLLISGVNGCGSSSKRTSPVEIEPVNGRVIQGPVDGAVVFADKNANRVRDDDEVWTESNRDGHFSLAVPVDYGPYQLVSHGGIDTLTNKPAFPMMAPARSTTGNTNITPITTIVALAPVAERESVKAKLEMLIGTSFDVDHAAAGGVSSHVLATVKAIEQNLTVVRNTFGVTSSEDQFELMKSIATEIAKSSVTFASGTDDLKTVLPAAIMESSQVKEMVKPGYNLVIRNIFTSVTDAVVQQVEDSEKTPDGMVIEDDALSNAVEQKQQDVLTEHQTSIDASVKTVRLTLAPITIITTKATEIVELNGKITVSAAMVSQAILAVDVFNNTGEAKIYPDEQLELVIRDEVSDRSARFKLSNVTVSVLDDKVATLDLGAARLDVIAVNTQGNSIETQQVSNNNNDLSGLVEFDQLHNKMIFYLADIQNQLADKVAADFADLRLTGSYSINLIAQNAPVVPKSILVIVAD